MEVEQLQHETNTFVGQVYEDEMFNCEMKVTKVGEDGVYIRETDLIEEKGEDGGSRYEWNYWNNNKQEDYRFTLLKDVEVEELSENNKRGGLFNY